MTTLRLSLLSALMLTTGCTLGVTQISSDKAAEGPAEGWGELVVSDTQLRVQGGLPGLQITGSNGATPSATATLHMLVAACSNGPCTRPQDSLLERSSIAFEGSAEQLSLVLDVPFTEEAAPYVSQLAVQLPRSKAVNVNVRNTPVNVEGVEGAVTVNTSNAAVQLSTTGQLAVDTSNGAVNGSVAAGTVRTSNAAVQLDWAALGNLTINTSNGRVVIGLGEHGADVTVDTSNGHVTVLGQEYKDDHFTGAVRGGGPALVIKTSNASVEIN